MIDPSELADTVTYQIGALDGFARAAGSHPNRIAILANAPVQARTNVET